MLVARDLDVTFGRAQILRDVSLALKEGELLAVVGPNGAGKSTLLHALTGDIKPKRGNVSLDDVSLRGWKPNELATRRAVLMQKSRLTFGFTVWEVVLLGRVPHKGNTSSQLDEQIVGEALQYVGMSHFADRLYPTLSGGEQQRVQLARVLSQIWQEPTQGSRYLFLDEPTASLDLAYQQQTLAIARRFAEEGTAVLAILHDLNLASRFADRIVMLQQGVVVADGTPNDVLTQAQIEAVFETPVVVIKHPNSGKPLITLN